MARALLIITGSSDVGSYINVMANSVSKFDIDHIALINVVGSPSGQEVDFENFANKILWDTLCDLAAGIYKVKDREGNEKVIPVPECEAYKKLKHVFGNSHRVVPVVYQFLKEDIEKLKNIYGPDTIVDVSSALKRIAIDVLTACLAVGMEDVTLFELKKRPSGVDTLYHNLKETDYEHVVLPNWEPLLGNIKFFSSRLNRRKLQLVVSSILLSLFLTVSYQLVRTRLGEENWLSWLLIIAIAVIGLVGGVTPILDAWGGIEPIFGSRNKS